MRNPDAYDQAIGAAQNGAFEPTNSTKADTFSEYPACARSDNRQEDLRTTLTIQPQPIM